MMKWKMSKSLRKEKMIMKKVMGWTEEICGLGEWGRGGTD